MPLRSNEGLRSKKNAIDRTLLQRRNKVETTKSCTNALLSLKNEETLQKSIALQIRIYAKQQPLAGK